MQVRLGVPASFVRFSQAAAKLGAPILVSANAFRRPGTDTFRLPKRHLFSGSPVALDSAGFVAMKRYGGFPWTVEEYVRLAGSYPWDWYAAPDLACEPEIAPDREEVRRRQDETARLLRCCRAEALRRNVPPPMPVLQGWRPTDYVRCASRFGDLPPLVGVGSVCRRPLSGHAGLLAVIEMLDRELPEGVACHLFGVKSTAIAKLAGHPRIHSVDSMSWDFAARYSKRGSSTLEHRIRVMRQWYERQTESLPQIAHGKPQGDVAAMWRQRNARARRRDQGLRQVTLWLSESALRELDVRRRQNETRSECAERLVRTMPDSP